MLLFYIRHGDPIYTPDSLTPLGEQQAEAVSRRLALFGVDEVYASTSNRAIQTAKYTCELLNKPLHTMDFLNENHLTGLKIPTEKNKMDWVWSHPDYEQLLADRSVRELGDRWYEHPRLAPFHLDRTILPINEQLDAFLSSLGYEHDREKGLYQVREDHAGKRIAVFAHECIGKIVMSHLLDIPFPSYAAHFEMHTSAMTVIRLERGSAGTEGYHYAQARVLTLSNDSHLYKEGLSLVHKFTHIREEY